MRKYKIGDRVLYTQANHIHKGALPYGGASYATVIAAFGGDGSSQMPTYRLLLDAVWTERENRFHVGEQIEVGNVYEGYISKIE